MKKKISLILCMIFCILAMTACGSKEEECMFTEEDAQDLTASVIEAVQYLAENEGTYYKETSFPYKAQMKAKDNYLMAVEEMGAIQGINDYHVSLSEDEVVVKVDVTGEKRDAQIEVIIALEMPDTFTVTSFAVNVDYTFGEQMGKAGLNTLLGMGTVFIVLILISLIIALFGFIPKLQEKKKNKKNKNDSSMDNTIAQIAEKEEEELADDTELVAVIAAAIAAYEGATSTDGFVVRSIRKSNSKKWQNMAPQA